jgi:hypothetical protein
MNETNDRFDQLLKAMVQGETPKASNEKQEREPDARTFRHKKPKDGSCAG